MVENQSRTAIGFGEKAEPSNPYDLYQAGDA